MNLCGFCIIQDLEYFENEECEHKKKEIVDKFAIATDLQRK